MDNSELIEIIDFFKRNKDFFKKEFGLLEIGLFGSVVKRIYTGNFRLYERN